MARASPISRAVRAPDDLGREGGPPRRMSVSEKLAVSAAIISVQKHSGARTGLRREYG